MSDQRLILLFGGRSREHEVSLSSAASALKLLQGSGIPIMPIGITRAGAWLLYEGEPARIRNGSWERDAACLTEVIPIHGGFLRKDTQKPLPPVVVFPCMHGETAEDGCLSGLLELFGIPYIGSGVEASALCFHKLLAKERLRRHRIPVLDFVGGDAGTDKDRTLLIRRAEGRLGYPMFVKPARAGSSIGAAPARTRGELQAALSAAAEIDPAVLIEPLCRGREIELSVLDGEPPTVAPPAEPIYGADYYDYDAKYRGGGAALSIPAALSPTVADRLARLALRTFRVLGCRHLARVDFFVCGSEVFVNEVNTLPGMTEASVFPHAMAAAGINFEQLVRRLARLALSSRR